MTMFSPLQRGLLRHFAKPQVTPGGQQIFTGTRPVDDGWVIAVIRIDHCTNEAEAIWLGSRIRADLLTHLCFTNQEKVPVGAVEVEHGIPPGGLGWSVAVFITLGSINEAEAMVSFLKGYAAQTHQSGDTI